MDSKIAAAAVQFLQRVQLAGSEVPAFNLVMAALQSEAQVEQIPADKRPEPQAVIKKVGAAAKK